MRSRARFRWALVAAIVLAAGSYVPLAQAKLPDSARVLRTNKRIEPVRQLHLANHTITYARNALTFLKRHPEAGTHRSRAIVRQDHTWLLHFGETKRDVALHRIDMQQRDAELRAVARRYGPTAALGWQMAADRGWSGYEWDSLYTLWRHESGWSTTAHNAHSDACGIPQAMNDCSYGYDAATQIRWGLGYIAGRYGSPSAALGHFYSAGWY